jgi:hypothetical protein
LGTFPQLFCLQKRHVRHTNFGTGGFANSIRPFFATVPCSHKTSEFVPLPLGIYYAWLSLYAGVLSFHVSGKASTHSAAMTQNPCAPTRA